MREWTFGSLFAGIGGFDLGLERAGWRCRWQVELDPFCQRVLAKHWPDVQRYGDVREFAREYNVERVDLICGGFPCQPVSVAGKRRAQADERWLWPEFARVVRALRPRYVLLENVPGLLAAGRGLAFGEVVGDLAASGYDAEWDCLPASTVGAPHRRDRVWLLAYAHGGERRSGGVGQDTGTDGRHDLGGRGALAHAERNGLEGIFTPWSEARATLRGDLVSDAAPVLGGEIVGDESDGVLPHLGDADGAPTDAYAEGRGPRGAARESGWWSVEPDVGRVAHGVPARVDRLRSLGNAIVPQVAEWIGRRLMAAVAER